MFQTQGIPSVHLSLMRANRYRRLQHPNKNRCPEVLDAEDIQIWAILSAQENSAGHLQHCRRIQGTGDQPTVAGTVSVNGVGVTARGL